MSNPTQDPSPSIPQLILKQRPSRLLPALRKNTKRLRYSLQYFTDRIDTLEADLVSLERERTHATRLAFQGTFLCETLEEFEEQMKDSGNLNLYSVQLPALDSLLSSGKSFSQFLKDYLKKAEATSEKATDEAQHALILAYQGSVLCQTLDEAESEAIQHLSQLKFPKLAALFGFGRVFRLKLEQFYRNTGSEAAPEAPPEDETHQT